MSMSPATPNSRIHFKYSSQFAVSLLGKENSEFVRKVNWGVVDWEDLLYYVELDTLYIPGCM